MSLTQPATTTFMCGRASFILRSACSCPCTLSSACWRTTHEYSTTTSAWCGPSAASRPYVSRRSARRRESATFIWQPMVQMLKLLMLMAASRVFGSIDGRRVFLSGRVFSVVESLRSSLEVHEFSFVVESLRSSLEVHEFSFVVESLRSSLEVHEFSFVVESLRSSLEVHEFSFVVESLRTFSPGAARPWTPARVARQRAGAARLRCRRTVLTRTTTRDWPLNDGVTEV